jgi:hypothetical protein
MSKRFVKDSYKNLKTNLITAENWSQNCLKIYSMVGAIFPKNTNYLNRYFLIKTIIDFCGSK